MEISDCLLEYWNYVGKGKNMVNAILVLKLKCKNSMLSGLPESITKG